MAETETVVFHCRTCGQAFTGELTRLREVREIEDNYGEPLFARGHYAFSADVLNCQTFESKERDEILIQLEDVHHLVAGGQRMGCCGPDGSGGMNLFCLEGHPIATEVSECYLPHFVRLSRGFVFARTMNPAMDWPIH